MLLHFNIEAILVVYILKKDNAMLLCEQILLKLASDKKLHRNNLWNNSEKAVVNVIIIER